MRWTLRTAGAVTAAALLAGALAAPAAHARDERLTDLVNPFIGTENEGNTFPGATVPFGMVQLSPDTGHKTGYRYSHTRIRGFSSSTSPASAAGSAATCRSCPRPATSRAPTTRPTPPSSPTTARARNPATTRWA